ncbi:MAG TPA: endolytic transglycosylase MltG [Gemmatimonadales bacterium]|nr:endolytic transglycosylase MltG [Gemmatimonadales bacterium]
MLALLLAACAAPSPTTPRERIVVPAGARFSAITDTLVAHGLVQHPLWFRGLARLRGIHRTTQAGTYDLPRGQSAWALLTALRDGRVAMKRFTSAEGLTLPEVAQEAAEQLGLPADSFLAAARDTALIRELGLDGKDLEGYLLPETYTIPVTTTARELVRLMAQQFLASWDPAWDAGLVERRLSRRQAVILASIVEGEAKLDAERPIIAAVYDNRVRLGMPLQADPTVQYAIWLKTGKRKKRLFEKDYLIRSPYNTYIIPGLPPGPVNSPGLASIRAAIEPASVPYLYFVADTGGHHVFTETYQEHLRAIRRVRGNR